MKRIVTLNALMLMFAFANAQTNPELKGLINQSFNYFPRIQELQKSSEVSAIRVKQAWSNYRPAVSGIGQYNYVNPISQANFGGGEIKFQPNNNYNFNLSVTQPIWDFGKTNAQIAKAKTDLLSANTNIEQ